jgi:hypothetical protein
MTQITCPGCEKQIPPAKACPYCKTPIPSSGGSGKVFLIAIGLAFLVFVFFEFPDTQKKAPDTKAGTGREDSSVAKILIDKDVCGSESNVIGEIIRPAGEVQLKVGPDLDSPRVINEKGSKATGSTMYRNIEGSTRVLAHCEKGGSTYVTLIEPEWLKGEGGWADTSLLRGKGSPNDPYSRLISDEVMKDYEGYEIAGDSAHPNYGLFRNREREINEHKVSAAKRAIDSGRCEYVSYVYFQWLESSVGNLRFSVECDQNKRITISEIDLAAGTEVRTNEERAVDRNTALQRCKDLIHAQIIRQSTAKYREILGSSYYVAPVTGNVRQVLDFEAQNRFGQTTKHRAVCIFDPDGGQEITITEK